MTDLCYLAAARVSSLITAAVLRHDPLPILWREREREREREKCIH